MAVFNNLSKAYTRLSPDESTDDHHDLLLAAGRPKRHDLGVRLSLILGCFVAGVLGNLFTDAVRTMSTVQQRSPKTVELSEHEVTFRYDRNFSYPPSEVTDGAWRSLLPEHGTFFALPRTSSQRGTFSVYHTLHCLDGVRRAYWANVQAAEEGRQLRDRDLPMDHRQSHMRHCIDLLRQSLMCQADTTVEVVDASIGGVHGFNTRHVCKDWDQLKLWTSMQQEARGGVVGR